MTINFLTPVVDISLVDKKNWNSFIPIVNFAEAYLNIGVRCYKFIAIKSDGRLSVVEHELPKQSWLCIALKIISFILSLGIFPLVLLMIKSLYRTYHPLFIDNGQREVAKDSTIKTLSNQPKEVLQKIFTEFLSIPLNYATLNKCFNTMINTNFMKWENLYLKMTADMCKEELDAFTKRINRKHQDLSFKQKVQFLCQELWEDAQQIPNAQKIIQKEKLTIGHLTRRELYDRFKTIIQPIRNENLVKMAMRLSQQEHSSKSLQNLLASEDFKKGSLEKRAYWIRNWFNSKENELTSVTQAILCHNLMNDRIHLLSTEMLAYIAIHMPNLKMLDLSNNELSSLPNIIGNLSHLHTLNLSNNDLSSLPESIGELNQLEKLNLDSNRLSTFPSSIEKLEKLKELNLRFNQLSKLPIDLEKINQLQKLNLACNKLSFLPDTIEKLNQLQQLDLHNNQFSSLPDGIGNLYQLQQLYLHKNQLSTLPKTIGKLKQLQSLFIPYHLHFNFLSIVKKSKKLRFFRLEISPGFSLPDPARQQIRQRLPNATIVLHHTNQ